MKKSWISVTFVVVLSACSSSSPTMQSSNPQTSASSAPAKAPDEAAALDTLRKAVDAQATHFKVNRRYALSFEELVQARLMPSEPTATQTGYDFKLRPAADAQTYKLSVVPAGGASARSFFADQTGTIRAETGKEATADSPEVK